MCLQVNVIAKLQAVALGEDGRNTSDLHVEDLSMP